MNRIYSLMILKTEKSKTKNLPSAEDLLATSHHVKKANRVYER
jgi:hypothetical protein